MQNIKSTHTKKWKVIKKLEETVLISISSPSLNWFKKQLYKITCIVNPIIHTNVINLTLTAQRKQVWVKLHKSKEMTSNYNLNLEEQMILRH